MEGEDTFVRPIYAGNARATVKSGDKVKVLTIRATAFDAAAAEGGSAAVEDVASTGDTGLAVFKGQELTRSERPELTTAGIVISGGRGMQSGGNFRSEEHTSELQSLMRTSYAVFCLKKKKTRINRVIQRTTAQ